MREKLIVLIIVNINVQLWEPTKPEIGLREAPAKINCFDNCKHKCPIMGTEDCNHTQF